MGLGRKWPISVHWKRMPVKAGVYCKCQFEELLSPTLVLRAIGPEARVEDWAISEVCILCGEEK